MQENERQNDLQTKGAKAPAQEAPNLPQALPKGEPLFELCYRMPYDAFYQFHLHMNRDAVALNRKKMRKVGIIEMVVGVGLLIAMVVMKRNDPLLMLMVAGMVMLGVYGMFYYDLIYPRALQRASRKQYEKVSYFQHEIVVEFYPDRCVEVVGEQRADTFWEKIYEFQETDILQLLMLEPKRCLLIPKQAIDAQSLEQLSALIDDVCVRYGKKRVRI